jgi:hypothetical protein
MNIGLLWHDSQKPVDLVVPLAAARYEQRFGESPNVCYVNPTVLPDGDRAVDGVLIKSSAQVLKFHYWLGVERGADAPVE